MTLAAAMAACGISRTQAHRMVRDGRLADVLRGKNAAGRWLVETGGDLTAFRALIASRIQCRYGAQRKTAHFKPSPAADKGTPVGDQEVAAPPAGAGDDSDPPDYNLSRARSEYERANLLELERRQKEALLVPLEQVTKAWANSVSIARTKLLGVPTRLRQRIPHLTLEEIAMADELIRESLQEVVEAGDVMDTQG